MRKIKQITTLLFFGLTMVVTLATSKKTDRYDKLDYKGEHITNYAVDSNCAGSINQATIRVNNSQIVDASFPADYYPDGSDGGIGHRSFEKIGFQYYYVNIGTDIRGTFELAGKDCIVKSRESLVNNDYDVRTSKYWFYKSGFFTKTTYDCYNQNQYLCSIVLEELPAGEFSEVNRNYWSVD